MSTRTPQVESASNYSGRSLHRVHLTEHKSATESQVVKQSLLSNLWHSLWDFWERIFAFPFFSPPRICFHRQVAEEEESSRDDTFQNAKMVEDLVNFDSDKTRELYAKILERRKEITATRDRYRREDVDVSKFPGWDALDIDRQRATFQIFDVSGDGLIDFDEFCEILTQFGDKTLQDIRYKYFSSVEIDDGTCGFDEFLQIIYRLTMQNVDASDQALAETFKRIDKNVAIRSKLDVLGQLQGGLF